ncbi:hypothetical protein ABZ543_08035 [Streptomyces roseifaciens]
MKKTFTLNTVPHVAEIGDVELEFMPEVYGDQFLEHYEALRAAQSSLGVDVDALSNVEPARLRQAVVALRVFLAKLMLPASAKTFAQWQVVAGGKTIGSYGDPAEAAEAAGRETGAEVEDVSMRLPDRVLVELLEWAVELYGGGGGRPSTSSNGSAQASRSPGTPGKAVSRSRA